MTRLPQITLTIALTLFFSQSLWSNSIFDLLSPSEGDLPLAVTLSYPVDSLHRKTLKQQEARFSFTDQAGDLQTWNLKVRVRGKSRLTNCDSPPLKLNFSKKDLRAADLSEFDKYKLVVPCSEGAEAEAAILREYLAYRAYNLISPLSYRVKLLRLTRLDDNNNQPPQVSLAFLLESTDQLAARTNTEKLNRSIGLPAVAYAPEYEATHALFQYLIGNTDWSNKLAMNIKKLKLENGALVPVGYDFDHSGWVEASYAKPRYDLGQEHIGDRVYLGYAQNNVVLKKVIRDFELARKSLFLLVKHPLLSGADRRTLQWSLRQFYQTLKHAQWAPKSSIYELLRGQDSHLIPAGHIEEEFMTK